MSRLGTNVSDSFIAGCVSGGVTRLVIAPLDVLKIRLQLQLEPIIASSSSKYSGMFNAVQVIFQEEGLSAFWKGLIPGEALYIVYGATQFVTFERSKRLLHTALPSYSTRHPYGIHFVSGCLAGSAATVVSFPFDVLRTRMIGQGEPKIYPNAYRAIRMMYLENGVRTFYRGLSPALVSVVPQAGLAFASYNIFGDLVLAEKLDRFSYIICGGLAGIVSKVLLMPLDLPKKRLEVQGFEKARVQFGHVGHYRGLLHCMMEVYKDEGPLAFYKGATPTIIKAALSMSVAFTVYEETLNYLRTRNVT